ncbi:MAG TPA: FtsX-like permease family protein, partial [bacterium]|nr:FtsX-like permease family protein [bacterium]
AGVFDVFSWPMIYGDPKTALQEINSVVLSESASKKYFGDDNPIGKILRYDGRIDLLVKGVIKDIPYNSHVRFEVLANIQTLLDVVGRESMSHWHAFYQLQTYLLLRNTFDAQSLIESLPSFVDKYLKGEFAESVGRTYTMELTPLTELHLSTSRKGEFSTVGSMNYVYVFSGIAFCLLSIACINFINLSTAHATKRHREIGLRKVLGANRSQLIRQFLTETTLLVFISITVALLLIDIVLPYFNTLAGKHFTFSIFADYTTLLTIPGLVVIVGILAGMYPAFYLSRFNPIESVRGSHYSGTKKTRFRHALVSIQFVVSIVLLIITAVVFRQLDFIQNKNIGIDKNQTLVIPVTDQQIRARYHSLREQLTTQPGIENVAISGFMPGIRVPGSPLQKIPTGPSDKWEFSTIPADENFVPTLGINIIAGRNFTKLNPTDSAESMLINEAAARDLGWTPEEAIGKPLAWGGDPGFNVRVIGVIKDFNYTSLHQPIKPLVIIPTALWPNSYNFLSIRINTGHLSETIHHINTVWEQRMPETPFIYSFLDDDFSKLYAGENKLGIIFLIFASLAIFVASLGLLGLATFVSESRRKEISIRKVVGADLRTLIILLLGDFLMPITISTLISWPIAYYIASAWLQNFAYRTEPTWYVFVAATLFSIGIAALMLIQYVIKTARVNPAVTLKSE